MVLANAGFMDAGWEKKVSGVGGEVLDAGCWMLDAGCWMMEGRKRCQVSGVGCRVSGERRWILNFLITELE